MSRHATKADRVGIALALCTGCKSSCEELRTDKANCFSEVPTEAECELDSADECASCFVDNIKDDCSNFKQVDDMCESTSACKAFNDSLRDN